jgi:hypothetical protein
VQGSERLRRLESGWALMPVLVLALVLVLVLALVLVLE